MILYCSLDEGNEVFLANLPYQESDLEEKYSITKKLGNLNPTAKCSNCIE